MATYDPLQFCGCLVIAGVWIACSTALMVIGDILNLPLLADNAAWVGFLLSCLFYAWLFKRDSDRMQREYIEREAVEAARPAGGESHDSESNQ